MALQTVNSVPKKKKLVSRPNISQDVQGEQYEHSYLERIQCWYNKRNRFFIPFKYSKIQIKNRLLKRINFQMFSNDEYGIIFQILSKVPIKATV